MRPAAVIVAKAGGLILAVHRSDNGLWSLPGGKVERSESLRQAAARELAEETGYCVPLDDLRPLVSIVRSTGRAVAFFHAERLCGALRPSHEGIPAWVSPDRVTMRPWAAFPQSAKLVLALL